MRKDKRSSQLALKGGCVFVCMLGMGVGEHSPGALLSAGDQKGRNSEEKLEQDLQRSEQGVPSIGEMYHPPFVLCCLL